MSQRGRWLPCTAVLLLLAAVIAVALIAAGVFDPRPIGTEQWQRPLAAATVPARSHRLLWLDQPLPEQPYSLRLTAAHHSGEPDIAYGLVLGTNHDYLAVALSPLGYIAIWQETSNQLPVNSQQYPSSLILHPSSFIPHPSSLILHPSSFILPLQPWPHVRTGARANELWIDVDRSGNSTDERITIRINRERLWSSLVARQEGQIGLWLESFGEAAAVDFQRLQLFRE